jgi:hypothetical protein
MGPVQPGSTGPLPKEYSNYFDIFVSVYNQINSQYNLGDSRDTQQNDEKLRTILCFIEKTPSLGVIFPDII